MKKMKEKRAWRFTALDLIILLVVLAAIGIAVYFFGPFSGGEDDGTLVDIEYTIELKGVDDQYVGNIQVGDIVIDSVTKREIGVVTAVENTAMIEYIVNTEDGVVEEKEYPGLSTILMTVRNTAALDERGYSIDGYRIAIGVQHYLQLPKYVGSGFCIGVEEAN